MFKFMRATLVAGCSIAALAHGATASARTSDQAAVTTPRPESADAAAGLSEIIVTAQKRSQSMQDVPATITALAGAELATRQIQNISDLTNRVPSLQVGRTFGANLITLRGISTSITSGFEDPSVAVHVNGVYQARSRSLDVALFDLERVEVLSGPQGTLYGRNATGGVLNYILRGPSDSFKGEITGRAGNYDRYAVQGSISGPLGDKMSFRLSGIWDNQNKGFTQNLAVGAPKASFEESKIVGGRGLLRFKPTDTLTIDFEGSYAKSTGSAYANASSFPATAGLIAILSPQSIAPHTVYSLLPAYRDTTEYQLSTTATLEISPHAELKSITAYQNFKNAMLYDSDFSQRVAVETLQDTNSHTFTQEFNLSVKSFDDRLSSIFGFYYFDDLATVDQRTTISLSAAVNALRSPNSQSSKSMAFFTDQTFSLLPTLRVIAGIRYNTDMKKADQSTTFNGNFTCTPRTTKRTDNAWTPRFGIQYDITPRIMAYVTYQKGFKSGGVVASSCGNQYAPENIEGYEFGFKSELADRRIRFNLAAYWYNYRNIQAQKTVITNGVSGVLVLNAASARIKGVEATLDAAISDNLRLDISAMAQSAKYLDFTSCDTSAFGGACSAADLRPDSIRLADLRGNWLNRAPDHSLNIGLEYTQKIGSGKVTLRGESYFSGTVRFNDFNSPVITQKPYDIQNAYLTYEPENRAFTARAYLKNAFNSQYLIHGYYFSTTQQYASTYAAPRTYGVDVTVRF